MLFSSLGDDNVQDDNEKVETQKVGFNICCAAFDLLQTLSEADTLQVSIESAKPLDRIEYICNTNPERHPTAWQFW